ncbi:MAG TPA: hypothetical protein VL383_13320 [Gemmatimonadaceae bacterium]|nr:hypothetical protein [Gemmatimonadaceae bacterium]
MLVIDRTEMGRRARRAAFTVLILSASASALATPRAAAAQKAAAGASATTRATTHAVDVRWYPWIGCWQRTADAGPGGTLTCVAPAAGPSSVDVVTIANGAIESREHLVVDARPHPIEKDGCTGSQTATWASSGSRLYIGSAYTCAGDLHGRSSTLYAILPTGEWIDARTVESGGGRVLTVTRYHDAGLPSTVPASVRSEIAHHALAATTARASAGASVSQTEMAEAQRAVDAVVVQAWLTARAQGYAANTSAPPPPQPVGEVRVYQSAPPVAAPPAVERLPSNRIPTCDSSGCYVENPYSELNGISYVPYSQYPTVWTGGYYYPYPYVAPIVVIRGGSRFGGHTPMQGRPPVIHMPLGRPPAGPSGVYPQPPPSGRVPGRIRP